MIVVFAPAPEIVIRSEKSELLVVRPPATTYFPAGTLITSSLTPLPSAVSHAPFSVHVAAQGPEPSAVVLTLYVVACAGAVKAKLAIVASAATIHRRAI